MHSLARKIVALFCLLIVSMPLLFSLKLIAEESLIELEVEERLEHETLQSIRIPLPELVWVRFGKEIMVDGEMFDVKSYSTRNNLVTLTGCFDTEETRLLEEYRDVTENNSGNDPLKEIAVKFLFAPACVSMSKELQDISWLAVAHTFGRFEEALPVAPALSFIQPPRS